MSQSLVRKPFRRALATLWIQGAALRRQQLDQHQQRFESSFFELLSLMREVRKEIRFGYSPEFVAVRSGRRKATTKIRYGSKAITRAVIELRFWLRKEGVIGSSASKEQISRIYLKRAHGRFESSFVPYFRLIYTILFRIENDRVLSEDEKARYANLLRSQLTSHEISLIAING